MTKNNLGKSYAKVMPACHWNDGPIYLLSNACSPNHKKQSHARTLSFILFCIAFCELLLMNRASLLASRKLLGGGGDGPSRPPDVRHWLDF